MANAVFHRKELAERLAGELLGDDPLRDSGHTGLFLAAPRRTGKTTFLRNDLIPAVESRGALALYVDLWSDKDRNPADLIADVVRDKLTEVASGFKAAKTLAQRLRKAKATVKFSGFEAEVGFEIESVGQPGGTTLAKAFEGMRKASGKQIVFIIDEAQHALTSKEGTSTLFALKAARDALNITGGKPGLAIVATGSVRGKISDMVGRKTQPFYKAAESPFPRLGIDFVAHLVRQMLGHRFKENELPESSAAMDAFVLLGSRPEELAEAIRLAVARPEEDLTLALREAAFEVHGRIIDTLRRQFSVR